jgi:hypothetical protein
MAVQCKIESNSYSAKNNYQLMDEESRGGMLFRWELPAHGQTVTIPEINITPITVFKECQLFSKLKCEMTL